MRPNRDEKSVESIYTERVVKVEKSTLADVVRRYDRVEFKTTVPIRPIKTKRLQGMTILYHLQKTIPLVLSLTDGRGLREDEYKRISQECYLPVLSNLLPPRPVRVGDTWQVPRLAARALVGDLPEDKDYDLKAELIEVRKNPAGNS